MNVNVHWHFNVPWADPPGNFHYTTDLEKGVILRWSPPQPETEDLQYEVRLFTNEQSDWKVLVNSAYQTLIGRLMFLNDCDLLSVLSHVTVLSWAGVGAPRIQTMPLWFPLPSQAFSANDSWLSLPGLSKKTLYTVQVRSQSLHFQEYWSNWSQPLYLCLSGEFGKLHQSNLTSELQ